MNKIVSFLTLGLMTFAVTLSTYTFTKEALFAANTEIQTVLFIDKNQVVLERVVLATIQQKSNTQHTAFSIPNRPQGCRAQSIDQTSTHIIPTIKTSRRL